MGTTFFIADLHLNHGRKTMTEEHRGVMKFCPKTRPYQTVSEMNEDLIEKINSVVGPDDKLYIVGDFAFGHTQAELNSWFYAFRTRNLYLGLGNHDPETVRAMPWKDVQMGYLLNFGSKNKPRKVHVSHFPYAEGQWEDAHKGSYHVYGHVHGKKVYNVPVRAIDVGVDSIGPVPISFEEIHERFQKIPVVVNHH